MYDSCSQNVTVIAVLTVYMYFWLIYELVTTQYALVCDAAPDAHFLITRIITQPVITCTVCAAFVLHGMFVTFSRTV